MVLRYPDSTCVDSLSKMAHQMWHDHQFNQRKRKIERTVRLGLEVTGKWGRGGGGGLTKFEKGKSSFLRTHVVTSRKFQLKQTWQLMKAIAQIKLDTEQVMKLE